MEVLQKEAFQQMKWKNGTGETTQLLIWPKGSSVASGFTLRLSSARMTGSNDFSLFEGYDRDLVLLETSAKTPVELLEKKDKEETTTSLLTVLEPWRPFHFVGEKQISCRLDGDAVDFNVICDRKTVESSVSVVSGVDELQFESQESKVDPKNHFTLFLYLHHGDCRVHDLSSSSSASSSSSSVSLTANQLLTVRGSQKLHATFSPNSKALLIKLHYHP